MYSINLKYSGVNIDIELSKRISVLSDDSGIGKTFLVSAIGDALKVKKFNAITISKDGEEADIVVIKEDSSIEEAKKKIESAKGLVIIDEADRLVAADNKICGMILEKDDIDFLLIMRGCYENLYINQNQYLSMQANKDKIIVRPFVSNVKKFRINLK